MWENKKEHFDHAVKVISLLVTLKRVWTEVPQEYKECEEGGKHQEKSEYLFVNNCMYEPRNAPSFVRNAISEYTIVVLKKMLSYYLSKTKCCLTANNHPNQLIITKECFENLVSRLKSKSRFQRNSK